MKNKFWKKVVGLGLACCMAAALLFADMASVEAGCYADMSPWYLIEDEDDSYD